MTTQIKTYDDLLKEKQRLQLLLKSQKEIVRTDIQEIKQELAPIKHAISFVGKLGTKDTSNPLLSATSDTLINLVVKKFLLARTGWATRIIVPFLLKNYSSHILSDNKDSIFRKIFSWVGNKNKNGKATKGEHGGVPEHEHKEN